MDKFHCEPSVDDLNRTTFAEKLLTIYERELSKYRDLKVEELGIGRKFAYLSTDRGQVGLSFVLPDEPLPKKLLNKKFAWDLLGHLWHGSVPTAFALTAANAIFQAFLDDNPAFVNFEGDFVEIFVSNCNGQTAVDFVGFVEGIAKNLKRRGFEITLYEDNPFHRREAEKVGIRTFSGSYLLVLKTADCLITTGSAWIDPRVYTALRLKNYSFTAAVGPTSSFHPEVLKEMGVNLIGGSFVPKENRRELLKLVKGGFGFRSVRHLVRKWVYI